MPNTFKLPPIHKLPPILAPPVTWNAPLPKAVDCVVFVTVVIPLDVKVVNAAVLGVALPIGVELIAAACNSPVRTLPDALMLTAFNVVVPTILANTLPDTFKLAPLNIAPELPMNAPNIPPPDTVVNTPVDGVALPIGVELIALACNRPVNTLPVTFNVV